MPSLTLWRRPGQWELTAGAVHSQSPVSAVLGQPGGDPWSPGGCCVPWLGMSLKSLDPLTPRTVTLLWPVPHCLAPLASLGSANCGIPSVGCASIHPHCWDRDRASHCVLWGSSNQLRAPQSWTSLGNVRVSGFPWQLPWRWWHILHRALPARCGAAAAGSCSGASQLASVFIEQISPNCFCCKASASESKDLPSTSRIAPQLSVIVSSPALLLCQGTIVPPACPVPIPIRFLSHWSGFPYLGGEGKCCMPLL